VQTVERLRGRALTRVGVCWSTPRRWYEWLPWVGDLVYRRRLTRYLRDPLGDRRVRHYLAEKE
jgi:hypothetical protein